MAESTSPPILALAERVAEVARALGIESALIGAIALAAHNYVRGTADVDLATNVDPGRALAGLQHGLQAIGLKAELHMPDEDDSLGGLLRIWQAEDEHGDPIDPIDVVNFFNPYRPGRINPGADAVRNAVSLGEGSKLRYVRLADLIALKLYAGSRRDQADVVELLVRNPGADLAEIRTCCVRFGFENLLDELLMEAR